MYLGSDRMYSVLSPVWYAHCKWCIVDVQLHTCIVTSILLYRSKTFSTVYNKVSLETWWVVLTCIHDCDHVICIVLLQAAVAFITVARGPPEPARSSHGTDTTMYRTVWPTSPWHDIHWGITILGTTTGMCIYMYGIDSVIILSSCKLDHMSSVWVQ